MTWNPVADNKQAAMGTQLCHLTRAGQEKSIVWSTAMKSGSQAAAIQQHSCTAAGRSALNAGQQFLISLGKKFYAVYLQCFTDFL
jgi:glutamate 5-kinase